MTVSVVLDAAGGRRSPATMPGYHAGRPPRNKGRLYPADSPTVEEIVAVMRGAGRAAQLPARPGHRLSGPLAGGDDTLDLLEIRTAPTLADAPEFPDRLVRSESLDAERTRTRRFALSGSSNINGRQLDMSRSCRPRDEPARRESNRKSTRVCVRRLRDPRRGSLWTPVSTSCLRFPGPLKRARSATAGGCYVPGWRRRLPIPRTVWIPYRREGCPSVSTAMARSRSPSFSQAAWCTSWPRSVARQPPLKYTFQLPPAARGRPQRCSDTTDASRPRPIRRCRRGSSSRRSENNRASPTRK